MKYSRAAFLALVVGAASLLAGCATYNLELMPRESGSIEQGTAKQIDKSVNVTIKGETYTGHYAYVQGGSFSFGTAFSGGQTASESVLLVMGTCWLRRHRATIFAACFPSVAGLSKEPAFA
jgi:hypothetical protein